MKFETQQSTIENRQSRTITAAVAFPLETWGNRIRVVPTHHVPSLTLWRFWCLWLARIAHWFSERSSPFREDHLSVPEGECISGGYSL